MADPEGYKPNGKPYRVVICEDRPIDAQQIRSFLESRGFKVIHIFNNGRQLLDWYSHSGRDADVITLDIIMPVLDGYATFHQLMQLDPKPKIVFISVENTASLIKSVLSKGAADFITKPLKRDVVIDRVSKVVRKT